MRFVNEERAAKRDPGVKAVAKMKKKKALREFRAMVEKEIVTGTGLQRNPQLMGSLKQAIRGLGKKSPTRRALQSVLESLDAKSSQTAGVISDGFWAAFLPGITVVVLAAFA